MLNRPALPAVVALMEKSTRDDYIAEAVRAAREGADGIAIGLGTLNPEFRTREELEKIVSCVELPFYVFFYRRDSWIPGNVTDDDARQEILLRAVDAGAAMIDVMGDLYDASPMEITRNPAAVERQIRLIERIHAAGAEVVLSSHMPVFRTPEETLEHLQCLAERGADIVKIVTAVNFPEELGEALRTTLLLKREMKIPFIHLCNGSCAGIHRFLCPTLGCAMSFAHTGYPTRPGVLQPMIAPLKSVTETIARNAGPLPR